MLPRFEAHTARSAEDDGAQPELSVVIASYDSRTSMDVCLVSLLRQSTDKPFEIILVDSATDGTAEHIREHYPRVRLLTSPERLYAGEARNRAMAVARAPIIAFLDADCFVEENWVEAILHAHHSPHWLVGGAVGNGSRSLVGWAYYFCEFSLWLPRSKPTEIPEMPGCCLSIKREAFEKYGPFLRDSYCSDTAFQWRAQQDGHRALSTHSIRVFHTINSTTHEFVTHVTMRRRFFARVARSQKKIGRWQRWMLVAFAPFYPFALVALTAGRVLRCPRYLPQFVLSLPLVFLGCYARVWGELIGLLEEIPRPSGA